MKINIEKFNVIDILAVIIIVGIFYSLIMFFLPKAEGSNGLSIWKCGKSFIDQRDSKIYPTVQIGSQCWISKNLAYLPSIDSPFKGSIKEPYYYVYGYEGTSISDAKETQNYLDSGVLYNWSAAIVSCPHGWHLPSDDEYKDLEVYLGMTREKANATSWRGVNQGSQLKNSGTSGWNGFPGGYRDVNSSFFYIGSVGYWWTSTSLDDNAWNRHLYTSASDVFRDAYYKAYGFSVRCIRD